MQYRSKKNSIDLRTAGTNDQKERKGKNERLVDQDKSRLRGESKENVHHLQAGCEKLAESEYMSEDMTMR